MPDKQKKDSLIDLLLQKYTQKVIYFINNNNQRNTTRCPLFNQKSTSVISQTIDYYNDNKKSFLVFRCLKEIYFTLFSKCLRAKKMSFSV